MSDDRSEHARRRGGWRLRATAWEFLALSLRYPDKELARHAASGAWAGAAAEIGEMLGCGIEGFECSIEPGASEEDVLHALRIESTRMFVGAPEPAVSPYESVWRASDDGVEACLFVNPHARDVERFCRQCGLGRSEDANDPLDHVAAECELLCYLASLAAGIVGPVGGRRGADLPGGSPAAAYERFMDEHARSWMPRFAELVRAETRQGFFRTSATLLEKLSCI
ncbi:molecular chaperone TorD family protein [Eggerthella guodeyinii]|uniref:Molecular chaperone TorD family protein n=1 Tax=Eggerthella guodeyinii TaxID=2690837 RepID=A0A6L7IZP2_9ACTN|nr:molecular chaperone TorD family protein [Eggerthella guodeyinii]QOS69015.1 molecular chaperone TorD family protein [Eggerthella guodeyinii]